MTCTGYSVVRGTAVTSFGVEVIDVIDDRTTGSGPRIMVRASGPAVDETGIGPGFSGSPVYCSGGRRRAARDRRDLGGDRRVRRQGGAGHADPGDARRPGRPAVGRASKAARAAAAKARPLVAPLTISGLNSRLGAALQKAAAKQGRIVLATPPAGPLGSFPVQRLVPGSAFGAGYADGDINASAIGTVTDVDGADVWGFGHPLDAVGARSLLLQDAYIFRVINNPSASFDSYGSYKYGAAGHALGTLTNDGLNAVVGRVGALPETVPVGDHRDGPRPGRREDGDHERRRRGGRRRAHRRLAAVTDRPAGRDPVGRDRPRRQPGAAHRARVLLDPARRAEGPDAVLQPLRLGLPRRVRGGQRGRRRGEHRPGATRCCGSTATRPARSP